MKLIEYERLFNEIERCLKDYKESPEPDQKQRKRFELELLLKKKSEIPDKIIKGYDKIYRFKYAKNVLNRYECFIYIVNICEDLKIKINLPINFKNPNFNKIINEIKECEI